MKYGKFSILWLSIAILFLNTTSGFSALDVDIISPNGGEIWQGGSYKDIVARISNGTLIYQLELRYSTDGGISFPNLVDTATQDFTGTGTYEGWLVPKIDSANVKIMVMATDSTTPVPNIGSSISQGTFTIDSTPPITTDNAPSGWQKSTVTVTLIPTDSLSGVAKTYYSINQGSWTEGTISLISADGTNTLCYYSVDNAGNIEATKTATVKTDKTTPTIILSPYIPDPTNDNTPTYKGTATDAITKIVEIMYRVDSGGWTIVDSFAEGLSVEFTFTTPSLSDGTHTIIVAAMDEAGNWRFSTPDTLVIDFTPPSVILPLYTPDPTNDNTPTYTGTAIDITTKIVDIEYRVDNGTWTDVTSFGSATTVNFSFTTGTLTDGTHTITVRAKDEANNWGTSTPDILVMDTLPPTIILPSCTPDPTNDNTPTYRGTVTDTTTKIKVIEYKVDSGGWTGVDSFAEGLSVAFTFTTSSLFDGTHTITVRVKDEAGNWETSASDILLIDTKPPTTTDNAPVGWQKATVTVTLVPSDNLSGVAKTYYSINQGAWTEGTTSLISTDGTNTLHYYSVDNAGNVEATKTATVSIDKTQPTVILPPYTPDPTNDNTPTYKGTVTDATTKIMEIKYKVDSGGWTDVEPFTPGLTIPFTFTTTSLSDGTHTISVRVKDEADNYAAAADTLLIDIQPPTTTDNIPSGWRNATVTVTLSPTDSLSGIAKTYYSINQGAWVDGTTSLISANGTNTLRYYSVDNAGNIEAAKTATVKIDKIPPTVTLTTLLRPNGGELFISGEPETIKWGSSTITDTLSGLPLSPTTLKYSIDGGMSYSVIESCENDGVYTWIVPETDSSNVKIKIIAVDNAGNLGEDVSDGTFTIASKVPKVNVIKPNGDENWAGGTNQNIQWSTGGIGIANVKIWYSTDGGNTYPNQINDTLLNTKTYTWAVPAIDSNQVRIKIAIYNQFDGKLAEDVSDGNFAIDSTPPTIENIRPSNEVVNDLPIISGWLRDVGILINSGIDGTSTKVYIDGSDSTIETISFDPNKSQINFEGNNFTATLKNSLSAGIHELKVWVADRAGNPAGTVSTTFTATKEQGVIKLINYPNPFSSGEKTIIKYILGQDCKVTINIYDISFKWITTIIEDVNRRAGEYKESWYGKNSIGENLPNGVYICELIAGGQKKYRKIVIYTSK